MKTLVLLLFLTLGSLAFSETPEFRSSYVSENLVTVEKSIDLIDSFFDSDKMFTEKNSKEIFTYTEAQNLKNYWFLYLETDNELKNIIAKAENENNQEMSLYGNLLRYKMGFKFFYNVTGKRNFEILLDEDDSRYGIPKKSFYQAKNELINNSKIKEINKKYTTYLKNNGVNSALDTEYRNFNALIEEYADTLLLKNQVDNIADKQKSIVFPPIKKMMNIGTKRVSRRKGGLISEEQSLEIAEALTPGDIIIERKDWYLSNLAFPGFWGHSALFIGSEEQLKKWSRDESIDNYFKQLDSNYTTFTEYLKNKYPKTYGDYIKNDFNEPYRILEALAPGVVWKTSSGSIGNADYVGVLRPAKLNKLDIAQAIDIAFSYYGRAYDYKFDFVSDKEMVCSELIYKSYATKEGKNGITFLFQQNLNKTYLSPSYLVKDFVQGKYKGVLDFVLFYDGYEELGKSVKSTEEEFNLSYDRPGLGFKHKPYKHIEEKDPAVNPSLYKEYKITPVNLSILFGGDNGSIYSREKKNTNILSINLINGMSDRLRGLEMGTFMNYVREDVKGVQLVLGTNGAVKDSYGVQLAGYKNTVANDFTGLQMSVITNYVGKDSKALQMSGFYNKAKNNRGIQFSLVNKAKTNKGMQVGLVNISDNKNFQWGLINYSDNNTSGVPFGLISLTKNPDIQVNTWFKNDDVYLGLETGNKKILNQIFFQRDLEDKKDFYLGQEFGMKFKKESLTLKPSVSYTFNFKNMPSLEEISGKLVLEKRLFSNFILNTGINLDFSFSDTNKTNSFNNLVLYENKNRALNQINLSLQYGLSYKF